MAWVGHGAGLYLVLIAVPVVLASIACCMQSGSDDARAPSGYFMTHDRSQRYESVAILRARLASGISGTWQGHSPMCNTSAYPRSECTGGTAALSLC